MTRFFSALLFAVALSPSNSQAQKRIYVNEYLNIGVGGRGLGMAGAQVASTNDAFSAFYNPAGLMQIKSDLQVGAMHAEYFAGNAKYDFANVAVPLKSKKRALAVSMLRYATDDIAYTIDYVQPDGSFDESKLKSISAGDYAFLLSYAQTVKIFRDDDLDDDEDGIETHIGVNAKVLYRHIGSMANAWGAGIDVGLQGRHKQWQFGIMLKDITTSYTSWSFHLTPREKEVFGQTGNEIPVKSYEVMLPRLNFGLARQLLTPGKPLTLLAEVDFDVTTDGKRSTLIANKAFSIDPHAGLEAGYKNTIFLRAGLGNIQRVLDDNDTANLAKTTLFQPSIGLGLKLKALNIDYAYTSLQTQSNPLYSHIVSLRVDIFRALKSDKNDNIKAASQKKLFKKRK